MKYSVLAMVLLVAVAGCTKKTSPFAPEYVEVPAQRPSDLGVDTSATSNSNTKPTQITQNTLSPTSPEYFKKSVGDRVLFDVDAYTLNAGGKSILDGQIRWLKDNPGYMVVIEGHADEQGTREYNLALGARRAQSVRDYMVANGVSPSRIRTLSLGKERPLEICSQESCYAKNRRAVTVLAGGIS